MIFSKEEVEKKNKFVSNPGSIQERVCHILEKKVEGDFNIEQIKVACSGGGAILYRVQGTTIDALLKVKNKYMYVESKLEEEREFLHESALYHEYNMLLEAKEDGISVPNVYFFDSDTEYDYLAVEYIQNSLLQTLKDSTIDKTLALWNDLEENVKKLFLNGMVHTDIHEQNIRCTDGRIVLIDFEECRYLKQACEFNESLDYIGYNEISNVGLHSEYIYEDYSNPYTCLDRMKEVFKEYMTKKLMNFTSQCNYDSSNGICTALDHGRSDKIYQEINNQYIVVAGQRSFDDRIYYIQGICNKIFEKRKFNFVDIGSNNGLFCRKMSIYYKDQCKCYGLEGTHNFNVLARGIAFLEDAKGITYEDFLCGVDDIEHLHIEGETIITICSVWHHITNKNMFLQQIKKINAQAIVFEMATQDDLYPAGSWRAELNRIKKVLEFEGELLLTYSEDYARPIIVIVPKEIKQYEETAMREKIQERLQAIHKLREGNSSVLDETYEEYIRRDKTLRKKYIVCYGAGNYGKRAMYFIGAEKIVFYIDNNKVNTGFSDHHVMTQSEALKVIDDDTTVVVTIDGEMGEKIKSNLIDMKVKNVITFNEVLKQGYIKKLESNHEK